MVRIISSLFVVSALSSQLCVSGFGVDKPNSQATKIDRRNAFGIIGSMITGAAALPSASNAVAFKVGPSNPFTGFYDDPNHPGCLRSVKVLGAPLRADGTRPANPIIEVVGYDGNGSSNVCTERPSRSDVWKIQGKMKSNTEAIIDFSPKGGPSNLAATWDDGIVFPDGNKWTKVASGTSDRLPKDMSTLKSD